MSEGRFTIKDGVVASEKVIAHDDVSGYDGNIKTTSYEILEFCVTFEDSEKREHYRAQGLFRVGVGDPIRVLLYDFDDPIPMPKWITKMGNQELTAGSRAVGFLNLRTHALHVAQEKMPYATWFAIQHSKKWQTHALWIGFLAAAGGCAAYGYHTAAWITGGMGILFIFSAVRQMVDVRSKKFACLFDDYCNLERRVGDLAKGSNTAALKDV